MKTFTLEKLLLVLILVALVYIIYLLSAKPPMHRSGGYEFRPFDSTASDASTHAGDPKKRRDTLLIPSGSLTANGLDYDNCGKKMHLYALITDSSHGSTDPKIYIMMDVNLPSVSDTTPRPGDPKDSDQ